MDKSFLDQYWIWLQHALTLNFGTSIQTSLPVTSEIRQRLPTTFFLGGYAFVLSMAFGIGFGLIAALRRQRATDRVLVGLAVVGLSSPAFVLGVVLLYVFAVQLHWFPAFGAGSGFVDVIWHLTLPATALALTTSAFVVKHTRAAVVGVLD